MEQHQIEYILNRLNIEHAEERGLDDLDFHEVNIKCLVDALKKAYDFGFEDGINYAFEGIQE